MSSIFSNCFLTYSVFSGLRSSVSIDIVIFSDVAPIALCAFSDDTASVIPVIVIRKNTRSDAISIEAT